MQTKNGKESKNNIQRTNKNHHSILDYLVLNTHTHTHTHTHIYIYIYINIYIYACVWVGACVSVSESEIECVIYNSGSITNGLSIPGDEING